MLLLLRSIWRVIRYGQALVREIMRVADAPTTARSVGYHAGTYVLYVHQRRGRRNLSCVVDTHVSKREPFCCFTHAERAKGEKQKQTSATGPGWGPINTTTVSITSFRQNKTETMPVQFKPCKHSIQSQSPDDINATCKLSRAWLLRVGTKIESADSMEKEVIRCRYNPFYAAIIKSFNDHVPLILYPDAIWLQIVQQLAIHVGENKEKLRQHFVDFEGKKEIRVRRDSFIKGQSRNAWEDVFPEFAEQIKGFLGNKNYDTIITEFSTTTHTTKAAQEIALMDCVQSYFDISMETRCGIPQITLEGTKEDWQILLDKTKTLSKYDLEWWTNQLVPVLEEFVLVFEGTVNQDFWESFVNVNGGSGGPYFTGHMTKFTAYRTVHGYDFDAMKPVNAGYERIQKWFSQPRQWTGLTTGHFTTGVSMVPFLWQYYEKVYPMNFFSGFVGVEIMDGGYRPCISWAVMDRPVSKEELKKEVNRFAGERKSKVRRTT
jgi:hypothetical protein